MKLSENLQNEFTPDSGGDGLFWPSTSDQGYQQTVELLRYRSRTGINNDYSVTWLNLEAISNSFLTVI